MRISDWSSDVCSSDLRGCLPVREPRGLDDAARELDLGDRLRGEFVLSGATELRGGVREIGRASCRERVCQYVSIPVVAVTLKKQTTLKIVYAANTRIDK